MACEHLHSGGGGGGVQANVYRLGLKRGDFLGVIAFPSGFLSVSLTSRSVMTPKKLENFRELWSSLNSAYLREIMARSLPHQPISVGTKLCLPSRRDSNPKQMLFNFCLFKGHFSPVCVRRSYDGTFWFPD